VISSAAVLYLYRHTDTVSYRPYEARLNHGTVLDWWVQSIRSNNPRIPVFILTNDRMLRVRRAWKAAGVEVLNTVGNHLQAYANAARTIGARHLAFLPLGFPLGPADLLERTLLHHVRARNQYTRPLALPRGVAPEIFQSRLLRQLQALDEPLPSLPSDAIQLLLNIATTSADALPFPIRATPLDLGSAYGLDPTILPERVEFSEPADIRRLRVLLRRVGRRHARPDQALRYWKRQSSQAHYRRLHARLPRTRPVAFGTGTRPQRILFITGHEAFTGAAEALCDLVGHLDRTRFAVTVQVDRNGLLSQRLRRSGARVICPERTLSRESAEHFAVFDQIIRSERPDLIHFNSVASRGALYAALAARVPLVQHQRSNIGPESADQARTGDAIIAVSRGIMRQLLQLDICPQSVHLVEDGVDIQRFRFGARARQAARTKLGFSPRTPVVLMIARFLPMKRHDLLLRAAARVARTFPRLRLLLVGDSSEDPACYGSVLRLLQSLGLQSLTTFLPFQRKVETVLRAADVLVQCSDGEPFGLCVLQAMAVGTPVVVTEGCGCSEIVGRHGGMVVAPNDAVALAKTLEHCLRTPEQSRERARGARRAAEELSADRVAAQVARVYDHLLFSKTSSVRSS
jgi:glycosyltransferase involved in cell wall biosynthesis